MYTYYLLQFVDTEAGFVDRDWREKRKKKMLTEKGAQLFETRAKRDMKLDSLSKSIFPLILTTIVTTNRNRVHGLVYCSN